MRIHTDRLTAADLYRELPAGLFLEAVERSSRRRARAFEVGISAQHGADAHGIARRYARNSGTNGGAGDYDRAATYIEWGDWMVALLKIDPEAVIGPYDGAGEFVSRTGEMAPHRQEREHAVEHAERWRRTLSVVAD